MPGLMQWRSPNDDDSTKTLYINTNGQWIHYSRSALAVPDYGGVHSPGFATAQKLLKMGFEYAPSVELIHSHG